MKIFASWSGEHSKAVATLLKTWLEDVLQGCSVWISSENIEKGTVWISDVSDTLKDTTFGVLCVTAENMTAPWLLFEAGALSKGLRASRVSPLLINISTNDLKGPLSSLSATLPTRDDMNRLVRTINNHGGEGRLSESRLERAFNKYWPEFESEFDAIAKKPWTQQSELPKRPEREILDEILEITKSLLRGSRDDLAFLDMQNQLAHARAVLNHVTEENARNRAKREAQDVI